MKGKLIRCATFFLAVMVILSTAGCSAAPSAPATTPSSVGDTFEPVAVGEMQKAMIFFPTTKSLSTCSANVKRINETLAAAGQNVELEVKPQMNGSDFFRNVMIELTAGNPSADAYGFNYLDSRILFDKNLTMDLTDLVRQNAQVYYSKYKHLFPDQLTGIPVGIVGNSLWCKTVLVLRQDFIQQGAGVDTIDGLFDFLDKGIVSKPYIITTYDYDLLIQWALEKGYYDLGMFGMDGLLFCGVNDTSFTPIPVENIPGFEDFILKLYRYRQNGSIKFPYDPEYEKERIGYVYNLGNYYVTKPYASIPFVDGTFAVQLFTPDIPSYFQEPGYINELVIPALCQEARAAEVVRFVEWLYAGHENYDSVIYGLKGKDFNDAGGRCALLADGNPLLDFSLDQIDKQFFAWPGAQYLFNFDYFRLPSWVPSNVEELVADGLKQDNRFALSAYMKTDLKTQDRIRKTDDDIKIVCRQRYTILEELLQGDSSSFTEKKLASSLDSLAKCKNQWLVDQYAAIIKGYMNSTK